MKTLAPETLDALAELTAPSLCSAADARVQLVAITAMSSAAREQAARVRTLLNAAELADETGTHVNVFERVRQTADATTKCADDLERAGRMLRISLAQLATVGKEIEASLNADLASAADVEVVP